MPLRRSSGLRVMIQWRDREYLVNRSPKILNGAFRTLDDFFYLSAHFHQFRFELRSILKQIEKIARKGAVEVEERCSQTVDDCVCFDGCDAGVTPRNIE